MNTAQPNAQKVARALLEQRARDLARPASSATAEYEISSAVGVHVLEIRLGDERIGVPLAQIVEVYRPPTLCAVPGARPPIAGVAAWRGRVLTVLDLAARRESPVALGDSARVIALGTGRAAFGLFADDVEEVQVVNDTDLLAPDDPSPMRAGIVRGVTRDALVVLDSIALLQRYTTPT